MGQPNLREQPSAGEVDADIRVEQEAASVTVLVESNSPATRLRVNLSAAASRELAAQLIRAATRLEPLE